ncbi:MAG: circularly permuted type 2 ATP-grasp protein [Acidobacteriota bacterium]
MTFPPEILEPPGRATLSSAYQTSPQVYDEMQAAPGVLRPHWEKLIQALDSMGADELVRRWEHARRTIRENGVTYNVYGDPRGMNRPWELDTIPLLIPAEEWRRLEEGLIQRARLLNFIVADLYNHQRLLLEGHLPPALVFANPAFLRPCHGFSVPGGVYLHHLAVDLARSPDGQWWVLSDRTQAPSGTGYALENRVVLSGTFPDLFQDCQVQRLASFFRAFRDTLTGVAQPKNGNPRIVLLTPGPFNETYFEHSYLARYLGFTLVQGGDLTVRENHVFLKTLEGLQPVDVILRRLDDSFCDPLELRSDSFLGVAGLVEAVKSGNVVVANALGSGLVETTSIMPFLPGLCARFLGEPLRLPSVATWWCGQDGPQQFVLDHLDHVVIKPAFPSVGMEPVFGSELTGDKRSEMMERIRQRPHAFVGQEQVALSTAPVWVNHQLQPRSIVLRTYLVASNGSYLVMPGGLTRMSMGPDTSVVSMQQGGGSKDTWVLSSVPVDTFSLLAPPDQPVELKRSTNDLPSRVADNVFWLGRYAERAENSARLLRTILTRLTGEARASERPAPALLVRMYDCLRPLPTASAENPKGDLLGELERELLLTIFDETRVGSLRETMLQISRVAAYVRDRFSTDSLRILSQLGVRSRPRGSVSTGEVLSLLNRSIITLVAFRGIEMENITRGPGWRFLNIGRRLERSSHLTHLLRRLLVPYEPDQGPLLEMLLEVADSSMTYRSRYFTTLQPAPVLDLLMADENNPRSLAFQLADLGEHFESLPPLRTTAAIDDERRIIAQLLDRIRRADIHALCEANTAHFRPLLAELLDAVSAMLPGVSNAITHSYFSLARASRPLASAHSGLTP